MCYSQCSLEFVLTALPEKQTQFFLLLHGIFFIEAAFAFEPYGWAVLQAVQLNMNIKVRYPETSLRLRMDVLKFQ